MQGLEWTRRKDSAGMVRDGGRCAYSRERDMVRVGDGTWCGRQTGHGHDAGRNTMRDGTWCGTGRELVH